MNSVDLILRQLENSVQWLKMTLGDFSDADLMVRPVPKANHPLWQIGHLIGGEVKMMSMVKPGAMPELPAGFAEKFSKNTVGIDDPAQFVASKQQLLELFDKVRAATIALVKTLKAEDLDQPAPEPMRSYCPTVADVLSLQSHHIMMHLGQIQVARRKLGKPILF
jgi:hypothetical protein